MNKLIPAISDLEITKAQKETIANQLIGLYLDGDVSPINIELRMKLMEDVIKSVRKDVRVQNTLFDVLSQHGNATYENGNVSMKISQRKSLDMSEDVELNELKAKVKAREAYLKALKQMVKRYPNSPWIYEQGNKAIKKATINNK